MARAFRLLLVILLVLGTAVFVVSQLSSGLDYTDSLTTADILSVGAAVLLLAFTVVVYGFVASTLLRWLEPASGNSSGRLRLFFYTWPLRYIPGTIPYHASRVLLADRLRASRRSIAAGLVYENVLLLGSAGFVGLTGVLIGLGLDTSGYVTYAGMGLLIASAPVILQPPVLLPLSAFLLRRLGRDAIPPESVISSGKTVFVFTVYGFTHGLQGLAFFLVLRAVSDQVPSVPLVIGAYVLAAGVGMVTPLVPSGLGVREAMVVVLLGSSAIPGAVLVAAGLIRIVSIIADLLPVAVISSLNVLQFLWRGALQRKRLAIPEERHA